MKCYSIFFHSYRWVSMIIQSPNIFIYKRNNDITFIINYTPLITMNDSCKAMIEIINPIILSNGDNLITIKINYTYTLLP